MARWWQDEHDECQDPAQPPGMLEVDVTEPAYLGTLLDARGNDLADVYEPRRPFGFTR